MANYPIAHVTWTNPDLSSAEDTAHTVESVGFLKQDDAELVVLWQTRFGGANGRLEIPKSLVQSIKVLNGPS